MKKAIMLILGCAMALSCSDKFSEEYQKEALAARAGGKTFALATGTTIISFKEFDPEDILNPGTPGIFKARLTAPPESDVVLDFIKAVDNCIPPDLGEKLVFSPEKLVFTPGNYDQEQEVEITVSDNGYKSGNRVHHVVLPDLESDDPLYNGVKAPTVYVTVFEDDVQPSMFPITPDPGETDVVLYREIKVQFDRAEMDTDSIIANTSVKDDADNDVPVTVTFDSGTKLATLYPHGYYRINTEYTVTMNNAIHDTYGNTLEKDWAWSFKTRTWTPTQKAKYTQSNDCEIFVSGNYVYVARNNDGLDIFDISSPASPVLVANYKHPVATNFYGICVNGNYAYIADYDYGLRILDVSNKAATALIGSCPLANAYTVRVEGTRAYVINGTLQSIDISNPSSPVAENYCDISSSSNDLFLTNGYAYVAGGSAGLQIIDISTTPGTPVSVGSCDTPGTAMGVYVEGTHAYVADHTNGLLVMDVSDPENPSITGHAGGSGLWAVDVHVSGSNAYVAGDFSGMLVVDISSPENPVIVSQYQLEYVEFHYIFVKSDYAYLTDWDSGNGSLYIVDISNPAAFTDRGTEATTGGAYHAVSAGDYTYAAAGDLYVFNTYSKKLVGTCDLTGARRVTVVGNKAYVAADADGLKIIDISNPASPSIIGGCDTPGTATGIMVKDNHAYVSFGTPGDDGLQIIDITDPLNPGTPVVYVIPGVSTANDVYVRGNYAYVSAHLQGLKIIDISDTDHPSLVSTFPTTTDSALSTFVYGDNAFIANNYDGLLVVDVSDPYNPYLRYRYDTEGQFMGVSVSGPNVVIADMDQGVQFFMQPW